MLAKAGVHYANSARDLATLGAGRTDVARNRDGNRRRRRSVHAVRGSHRIPFRNSPRREGFA